MDEHNYELTKPKHSHILRYHRRLFVPQKVEAVELGLGGLTFIIFLQGRRRKKLKAGMQRVS
jgi:hypothetical protein